MKTNKDGGLIRRALSVRWMEARVSGTVIHQANCARVRRLAGRRDAGVYMLNKPVSLTRRMRGTHNDIRGGVTTQTPPAWSHDLSHTHTELKMSNSNG